jgi:hypothetical protein
MENLTYEEFINNILETRGRFACGDEYHERHHIVPRCMDGGNEEDNLIDLFAREHFIAHKLLAQENPDNNKLVYAWWMLAHIDDRDITPEEYEEARINFASAHKGHSVSDEVRSKLRDFHTGLKASEETRKKMSESRKGYVCPDEIRKKISESNRGHYVSEETKEKISKSKKGKYCGENNPLWGKPIPDDVKEKIRQTLTGRKRTEESKRKQSESLMGHFVSDETRKKMSNARQGEKNYMFGKKHSEETREKMRKTHSERENRNSKKVVRLVDGVIYESLTVAAKDNNMDRHKVAKYCKQHEVFMFYDEWLTQQIDEEEDIDAV